MTGAILRFTVPPEAAGARLDRFLAGEVRDHTRSWLERLIREGRVRVDGLPASKPGVGLRHGMTVEVELPEPAPPRPVPEDIPLDIIHEDEHVVLVSKPAGLVVHPGHGRRTGTLVNALLGRGTPLAAAGGVDRPGIVHRLDADTSGVLVVAKTDEAHRALAAAFARREVRKVYHALVWGHPDPPCARIDRSIGRARSNPTRMSVHAARGRQARTEYRTIEVLPGFSFLEVGLETGRTHQIRVHLQSIGHPVVGDTRYGGQQWRGVRDPDKRGALRDFRRLALHASELEFTHPASGQRVCFRAPLAAELTLLLDVLRRTA